MNLLENRLHHGARIASIAGICLFLGIGIATSTRGLEIVKAQTAPLSAHAPAGWFLAGSKPANYATGVDKSVVNNGQPSAFLRSTAPSTDGFGTLMQSINSTDYAGKRVRLRAWVKSQDVADWAGVWMRVDKDRETVAFDNMQSRAIKGSQAWTVHDVVLDVPQGATAISFGILLSGTGTVWMNDVTFEVVSENVPATSATPQTSKLPDRPTNLKFTE